MCFAVPEKEVKAVADVLESRFGQALSAGRLSQVLCFPDCVWEVNSVVNPIVIEREKRCVQFLGPSLVNAFCINCTFHILVKVLI